MDLTAFFKASYGLYVVSSRLGDRACGCIINTFTQVTAVPEQAIIAINKENCTTEAILDSGVFAISVLTEEADMDLIGRFGFQNSKEIDKFEGVPSAADENGVLYLKKSCAARYTCRVVGQMDVGTHIVFLARVEEAEHVSSEPVMTYSYYHAVRKGLTPPKASSYQAEAPKEEDEKTGKKKFRCTICGYTTEADELPDDYICPICKKGKDKFVEVTE